MKYLQFFWGLMGVIILLVILVYFSICCCVIRYNTNDIDTATEIKDTDLEKNIKKNIIREVTTDKTEKTALLS